MYIAHIRKTDKKEQSVFEHSKNTARLCEGYLVPVGLGATGRIGGLFHDGGKFTTRFNDYIHELSDDKRGDIDHSYAGARFLLDEAGNKAEGIALAAATLIAHTIISHHAIHDWIDNNDENYLEKRIAKSDGYDEASKNIRELLADEDIAELLSRSAKEIMSKLRRLKTKDNTAKAFYIGMLERLIQSALIDADRTDTADFMAGRETIFTQDTASALWEKMDGRMDEKLKAFGEKTDPISLRRRSISDRCADFAEHKVGVCRLIVPTGGGKTLSSMRFAIKQCRKFGMERIFYIAPFMSILEQNSDVIRSLAGDDFLEHHSNIIAEIDGENELNEYQLHTERWDKSVIATTMVQFLNTLFSYKTSSVRRMHRLCNSVIIIDEVQSVPIKCVNMFSLAVNFLAKACGCSVVLCSATQPTFEKNNYAIDFDESKDMISGYDEDYRFFRRTEVINALTKFGYDNEQAADFCYDKFKENGDLLLVVNTKAEALELYRLLKEKAASEAYLIHLSTNMCPAHRKKRIGTLKRFLKKRKPVICVTTQLIEAGVDISFRCVVRVLAGMDNAAQAAGRCNRNGENEGLCPVYLINLKDESRLRLEEIKNAQNISRQVLKNASDDLLSVEIQSEYFTKLYGLYGDKLSYIAKQNGSNISLLELLSLNGEKYSACRGNRPDKNMSQSFKTAGELFEVIDSKTLNVIVPYNKQAQEIILKLQSAPSADELDNLLRKAQKYTVGIYKGIELKLLDNNALSPCNCGATVLKKEHYSPEYGVTIDGAERELLMY